MIAQVFKKHFNFHKITIEHKNKSEGNSLAFYSSFSQNAPFDVVIIAYFPNL